MQSAEPDLFNYSVLYDLVKTNTVYLYVLSCLSHSTIRLYKDHVAYIIHLARYQIRYVVQSYLEMSGACRESFMH